MPEPIELTTARIESRKLAESIFEYAVSESAKFPEEVRGRIWSLLAYRIAEHTGTITDSPATRPPSKPSFTNEQARSFERGRIPFKTKHSDNAIADVPLGFLHWLLEKHQSDRRWFDDLAAYLNSKRVAAEEVVSDEAD